MGREHTAAIIQKQINDPVPSARIQLPELPPAVDDVIQKATAKDPTQRFSNVSEMRRGVSIGRFEPKWGSDNRSSGNKSIVNPYKGLRPFEEAEAPGRFFWPSGSYCPTIGPPGRKPLLSPCRPQRQRQIERRKSRA